MPTWAVLTFVFVILATSTFFMFVNRGLGPRSRVTAVKRELFECGVPATVPPPTQYPVYFYRLAVVFVILDVELAFFLPWAVLARPLGWPGLVLMGVYAGTLAVGLLYFWRHGGLVFWEQPVAGSVGTGVPIQKPAYATERRGHSLVSSQTES
ncbi:MAG: NADH-quinone oxidoreductase subunit A [Acidobacteria bacterium]|nr:NADH-quinone oxidoreductase subunit A [Acidobacteriota bacterium]MDW7985277.1 NADH-quinone oxidoreductase subunit A [Acidobacteriota bacterium]